ncbi:MAG: LexA family transcriptional regulator [Betaproteobacteria bacterium]|nr:LexA family transcriptional regulator [Betaproteobacteria bacterium]
MADDNQYLLKLQDYYAKHRVMPSYATLGELVGLSSKASVAELVLRLKAERLVESTPDRRLKPGKRFFERSLEESVHAGMPHPAFDSRPETVSIDDYLVYHPSKTTLITVKGDSMINAGIHDGDIVVVEKRATANVNDLVVAIVEGEFTLKRLGREKGRMVLIPENKAYPVIRPKEDLEIFGVVVGQFRRYR